MNAGIDPIWFVAGDSHHREISKIYEFSGHSIENLPDFSAAYLLAVILLSEKIEAAYGTSIKNGG